MTLRESASSWETLLVAHRCPCMYPLLCSVTPLLETLHYCGQLSASCIVMKRSSFQQQDFLEILVPRYKEDALHTSKVNIIDYQELGVII